MSQLVGVRTAYGVLIAADSRVEVRGVDATSVEWRKKLYPLGPGAAIATGGAAVGIDICKKLSRHFADAGEVRFDGLESYTREFFITEYSKFIASGKAWFASNPEALKLSYFLLAGRDDGEFCMRFYASEAHGETHRSLPIGDVVTAPRRMGLEGRVLSAIKGGAKMEELKALVLAGLELIADKVREVEGPFDVIVIE